MKKPSAVIVGLVAFVLTSVSCVRVRADETPRSPLGGPAQYAKLDPVATKPTVRVGPFSPPLSAPERLPYPVKLALAQPKASSAPATASQDFRRMSRFSLMESASEHLDEVITVFGERVVPSPSVSGLLHIEESHARAAADAYQWTFWKYKNDANRPLFGTDFLFTYRYPTEGQAPRGFRSGEVIVGLGVNIPLTSFRPIGLLFTSR